MAERYASALYQRDPAAYLSAFWELDDAYGWTETELDLVQGVGHFLSQDAYEGTNEIVAMGFLAGHLEEWLLEELAEHRISTIWRDEIEADMAIRFDEEWDAPNWARVMFCVIHFENMLEEFCFDREHLEERLAFLSDAAVENIIEGDLAELLPAWRSFHRSGTGCSLFVRWSSLMDELNVPEHERWTENALVRPISDTLVSLDFPMRIKGCDVLREDFVGGYEIRSRGILGGGHWMRFRALGDTAAIVVSMNEGRLGTRPARVPEPRHVDVLRELGFQRMIWPDGSRYELRFWPGVRRLTR